MSKFFNVQFLGDGIYCLKDLSTVQMYLVIGEDRAALLDTGTGIGNLKEEVESLTDKPVEVYITHGHVDHAGGAYAFDKIHMSHRDLELMKRHATWEMRKEFAEFVAGLTNEKIWTDEDLPLDWDIPVCPLDPGEEIDLGGRVLTVVDMAGHTLGSVGFLDSRTHTLFAGDGCNNSSFLFLPESTSITDYRQTLLRLKRDYGDRIRRMMIFHDYTEVPLNCIDNVLECCDHILAGTDAAEHFDYTFEQLACTTAAWAAPGGADRCDCRFGNVAYDTKRRR